MKKNIKLIMSIIFLMMILTILFILNKNNKEYNIPNNYIAIFHGGIGEKTYETYIYKIDNGRSNYGFKYINVTNTKNSWENSNWQHKITKKGEFDWTDGAFIIAKSNSAYSYVTVPNDDKTYTIEEFQSRFIMN